MTHQNDIDKAWADFSHELDQWHQLGKTATLWWRDDDAQFSAAQLDRLIDLSATTRTPLVIAAIPHQIDSALRKTIKQGHDITIVQHGWSHQNHAPNAQKKAELGDHRPLSETYSELAQGATILKDLFSDRFAPAIVPPWNRIGTNVKSQLAKQGYRAVSTFGNAIPQETTANLKQINTHIDLINWRGDRGFIGTHLALASITSHLSQRRNNEIPAQEITGILTHHLVHDELLWSFLAELFTFTHKHSAASWLSGNDLFNR